MDAVTRDEIDEDDISRDTYDDAHEELDEVRLYKYEDLMLPSVTTVLKTRDEDKSNLYDWQDRNDGEGDNAFHKHLFWYKRHRGTLCHWHALSRLDEDLEWSDDEEQSLNELTLQNEDEVDGDPSREVLYSVLKCQHAVESWGEFYDQHQPYKNSRYYEQALLDQKDRDVDFFVETFDGICDRLGIEEEHVIAVEEFLFNDIDGYAGQVDLVYECPTTGETVVADLKTSSGCYSKHKIQGAAYGNSVEKLLGLDVDRLEVWRIHPDSGQWAVHSHDEATEVHTSKYWKKDYDELLDTFLGLSEDFEFQPPEDNREEKEPITFTG